MKQDKNFPFLNFLIKILMDLSFNFLKKMNKIAAFYKFVSIKPDELKLLAKRIEHKLQELQILGTILLAQEGINATIAGASSKMDDFLSFLREIQFFKYLDLKFSFAEKIPFRKCKVRIKNEILTFGEKNCDPTQRTGVHVSSNEWNELIKDVNTCVIDVRNDYEVKCGSFFRAINPNTQTFVEFKDFVRKKLSDQKNKKIAMFCTGGIRCEKASAFMLNEGFNDVYQLDGGILRYLETEKKEDLWKGSCFIFDDRQELSSNLSPIKN